MGHQLQMLLGLLHFHIDWPSIYKEMLKNARAFFAPSSALALDTVVTS